MDTSANVGDTSLADVDSIDTPPRVTPAPSPLLQATSAAETAKGKRSTEQHRTHDSLEDVFGSQMSSARARAAPTTADSSHRAVPPADSPREGSRSNPTARSSMTAVADTATGTASASPSSIGAAVRTRVPSKESLYNRHRSSSHRSSKHSRTHSTAAAEKSRPAAGAPSSPNPYVSISDTSAAGTSPRPAHPPTSALAEQYGGGSIGDHVTESITEKHTARSHVTEQLAHLQRDAAISTDALLRRMQHKEKEFDEKIHVIHDTFQSAGEQLVMRDAIIAQLRDELAQLRAEASRIPKEYQAREEKLLLRVEEMMGELSEEQQRMQRRRHSADAEVKQLRAALRTADQQLAQQQRVSADLLRQLRASDKALQETKGKHATALQESRHTYEDKLVEFQRAYGAVEKDLMKAQTRNEEIEKERAECQAKLLAYELDNRRRHSSDTQRVRALAVENDALREEVEAVQLSMARLLRLMSDVPALADYLQWNELDSEFVFLGYPTRYFANGNSSGVACAKRGVTPAQRGQSPSRSQRTDSRQTSPARRPRRNDAERSGVRRSPTSSTSAVSAPAGASSYYQDANLSGLGDAPFATGVEDGVYAGIASTLSKNVWLNGRWAQQMLDIIAAENNFTRLKRIKLLELEEAGQLSEQLPSARDVLEGRRQEHDYWIPYAVFTEAQKFKNKYYPKLPAMSHFYPFLIQLNKIWQAKLQDRLRVRACERPRSTPRQRTTSANTTRAATAMDSSCLSRLRRTRAAASAGEAGSNAAYDTVEAAFDDSSRLTSRSVGASQLDAQHSEALLRQLVRCETHAEDIRTEHHRLRRDVRLHVSSQRTLQLFRAYDDLVRDAHQSLTEMAELINDLHYHSSAAGNQETLNKSQSGGQVAVEALREAQMQSQQNAAAAAEASDARDQLLCTVERTCERVCDVGDSLSSRMLSYYSDLNQLIYMLHHHIRDLRERSAAGGAEDNKVRSSSSSGSDTSNLNRKSSSSQQRRREEKRKAGLERKLRHALYDQYGVAESSQGRVGSDSPASVQASCISVDSLLKLAASVLDFGDEVRKEVTDASAALRQIAEQAMHDAEQLHTTS